MWTSEVELNIGEAAEVTIGPARIVVQRLVGEWRIAREEIATATGNSIDPLPLESALDAERVERITASHQDRKLAFRPMLADGPVVTKPELSFHVPANGRTAVFVGTPLWFRIHNPQSVIDLLDAPIVLPYRTWFGPNTREGELCYSSRTFCRLDLEGTEPLPHRALTLVNIVNDSAESLHLQRMRIPVPQLALYRDSMHRFWTQDVTFHRTDEGGYDFAAVRLHDGPPAHAKDAERVAPPRNVKSDHQFVRVFSAFFD